jgi:hypothetical protein
MSTPIKAALVCLLALGANLHAQVTTPQKPKDEDILQLSPFTVSADNETGYLANSTLAGTRLNTPLKDIGAPISVLTEELLKDLGISDGIDILAYATNTEVGGVFGNFTGSGLDREGNNDSGRVNPNGNNRSRGLAELTLTRDFFASDIPGDQYNTTDITLSRGPNAILAGTGSPGGILDSTLKAALFRNRDTVTLQFGPHGSHRVTVDVNQQLFNKRLAVRLSLLEEDQKFQQQPAHMADKRVYGAITWRMHLGKAGAFFGDTTLRANFESGKIEGTPPNSAPPTDSFSSWWSVNKPSYNSVTDQYTDANGAVTTGFLTARLMTNAYFRNFAVFMSTPDGLTPDIGFTAAGFAGAQGMTGTIPADAGGLVTKTRSYLVSANVNQAVIDKTYVRMTDAQRSIFDFRNNLLTGAYDNVKNSFHAHNLRLEQLFWGGKAGLEVVADDQHFTRDNNLPFAGRFTEIKIDATKVLPNGQLNPNFGRPFIYASSVNKLQQYTSNLQSWRATAFAQMDFTRDHDYFRRFFGRHTLTALATGTTITKRTDNFNSTWMSADPAVNVTTILGQAPGTFGRNVNQMLYLGDSVAALGSFDEMRVSVPTARLAQPGDVVNVSYYDAVKNTFRLDPMTVTQVETKAVLTRQKIESYATSLQSYWLNDHLISLVGWRQDGAKSFTASDPVTLADGNVDLQTLILSSLPSADEVVNSTTYSLVGVLPKKLVRLPFDSDLRVHWSTSSNFSPVGQRRNSFNEEIGGPRGKTTDYGVTLSAFHGKVDLRVNWFKTPVDNATDTSVSALAAIGYTFTTINRMLNADLGGVTAADSGYSNFATLTDVALAHFNAIPSRTKIGAAYNFAPRLVKGSDGRYTLESDAINNAASSTSFVARGIEFEVMFNPTKDWRLAFNASRTETVKSAVGVEAREWIDTYLTNLQKVSPQLLTGWREPGQNSSTWLSQFRTTAVIPLEVAEQQTGRVSPELRKWHWNVMSRYDFRHGSLKGTYVGGALRWQDKAVIGYPLIIDAGSGLSTADLANPYFSKTELNGDAFVGYRKTKLFRGKIDWSVQLNVRNIVGRKDLIVVTRDADGSAGVTRIPPERAWSLTNTFNF